MNRLFKAKTIALIIKLLTLKSLYKSHSDYFWKYFILLKLYDRYTKTKNVFISLYFSELSYLLKINLVTSKSYLMGGKVTLLGLPICSKAINNTLLFHLSTYSLMYLPYFSKYQLKELYFPVTPDLRLYNNLNFYYLTMYEH